MRFQLSVLCFSLSLATAAQQVKPLPEFVYIPQSADHYEWTRVLRVRPRTLFNNSIAVGDSVVWSFGGYNTQRVQRALYRVEDGTLVRDSISYPGPGFMNSLFFEHDSALYLGGGLDSGAARFSFEDFWRYDLRKRSWTRLPDLPFYYLQPLNIFMDGDRVIVLVMQLSGPALDMAQPRCYSYDPVSGTWKILSVPISATQFVAGATTASADVGLRAAAFRIDTALYVLFQPWQIFSNTFFRLDLASGAWTKLEAFPAPEQSFTASFAFGDGTFGYVGGGRLQRSAGNSREAFRYDPVRLKWERIADLPLGVRYAKGWMFQGERYVGFGINDKDETIMVWKLRRRRD